MLLYLEFFLLPNACKPRVVTNYRHDVMSLCIIANACKRQDVFMRNINNKLSKIEYEKVIIY